MKKILQKLKQFFLPPAGTPTPLRILPYAILGLLTVAVLAAGTAGWNYTNSSEFCGTACHTMPPEYSAYLISPHARVQCVECHIGRDVITTQFTRKAGDLRHVVLNLTKQYEYPIRAHQMRPARESCETCHFPEKFSDDSLREIKQYSYDENNTPQSLFLVMKTGGGTQRQGLGYGIHWHIENQVEYLATDPQEQEIPYVRVTDVDGNVTEYFDISSEYTSPEDIDASELVPMDCITCHNRITHNVSNPDEAVNQALTKELISNDLPYIKEQSVKLLRAEYPSKEQALASMDALAAFYVVNYPEIFEAQKDQIAQAVNTLQDIYDQSVFPEQQFDWDTHANNIGHQDSPGCFRCHDGEHLTQNEEAIRLECNICHAIPVIAGPGELTTEIEVARGPEPTSHTHTSWMALHGKAIDQTCATCHTPPDPSVDYTQLASKPPAGDYFCGNEACHSNTFTYAGFDSPSLQPILERQLEALLPPPTPAIELEEPTGDEPAEPAGPLTYANTFQGLFDNRCSVCHGESTPSGGLTVTNYVALLESGDSGAGIVPGDPQASQVIIRQSSGDHYAQFTDAELQAVIEWVAAGAPEN
ncbi:MAG: NapC/NirT family cytochrome c [Anaerolineales bacterium]|nr:NapC/NirT family cytochrome c [Anaerolineales bacterium]